MPDKAELERRVRRATQAQTLLDNELFKEVAEKVRETAFEVFKNVPPADIDGLRHARIAYETSNEFEAVLDKIIKDGQMADHKLKENSK